MSGRPSVKQAFAFSKSATKRSANYLLSSSGHLAILSLIASVITFFFVLWFQGSMYEQSEVSEPIARATLELKSGLHQTDAILRHWVSHGDENAKSSRRSIWERDIQGNLDVIREAASDTGDTVQEEQLAKLHELLKEIKHHQWVIEDISRVPLNEPARSYYDVEMSSVRRNIISFLSERVQSKQNGAQAKGDFLFAGLWALIETIDRDVSQLLDSGSDALVDEIDVNLGHVDVQMKQIAVQGVDSSHEFEREVEAYLSRVDQVVKIRQMPAWNQSNLVYDTVLKPAQIEATSLVNIISQHQYDSVTTTKRSLFRWSFLILALALLVGILSLMSLYVSRRAQERVNVALKKAQSVGKYVLGDFLGSGGMGQVFQATHTLLKRPAAIKVLHSKRLLDPHAQTLFDHEVQATSKLSHPNTISILDYGKTASGFFYYAMELLQGVSLDEWVKHFGPMPSGRIVHVLRQICGSLAEAHSQGLLHRDLKPSNVMLAELGGIGDFVKVFDFGLAKSFQDREGDEESGFAIIGTPEYVAPETIGHTDHASPRSDVYSLGALAYYLCTGTELFPYDDEREILNAHLSEAIELPSKRLDATVPVDLEAIIVGCLAKKTSERPQTIPALKALLCEADVPAWNQSDADRWWEKFGETIRIEAASRLTNESPMIGPDEFRLSRKR